MQHNGISVHERSPRDHDHEFYRCDKVTMIMFEGDFVTRAMRDVTPVHHLPSDGTIHRSSLQIDRRHTRKNKFTRIFQTAIQDIGFRRLSTLTSMGLGASRVSSLSLRHHSPTFPQWLAPHHQGVLNVEQT
jgi:hypothetical protein